MIPSKAIPCRICGKERQIALSKIKSGNWPRICRDCSVKANGITLKGERVRRVMD